MTINPTVLRPVVFNGYTFYHGRLITFVFSMGSYFGEDLLFFKTTDVENIIIRARNYAQLQYFRGNFEEHDIENYKNLLWFSIFAEIVKGDDTGIFVNRVQSRIYRDKEHIVPVMRPVANGDKTYFDYAADWLSSVCIPQNQVEEIMNNETDFFHIDTHIRYDNFSGHPYCSYDFRVIEQDETPVLESYSEGYDETDLAFYLRSFNSYSLN